MSYVRGNDHGAGAFVREDLGEERVAFGAADDVCAVNAAFQQDNDALEFWNHAARGRAAIDQFAGFGWRSDATTSSADRRR